MQINRDLLEDVLKAIASNPTMENIKAQYDSLDDAHRKHLIKLAKFVDSRNKEGVDNGEGDD